jgi:hypothetical protein
MELTHLRRHGHLVFPLRINQRKGLDPRSRIDEVTHQGTDVAFAEGRASANPAFIAATSLKFTFPQRYVGFTMIRELNVHGAVAFVRNDAHFDTSAFWFDGRQ